MDKFSKPTTNKDGNFIIFSSLRNGFLKKFIHKHHKSQAKKTSEYELIEISSLLLMSVLLLRTVKSITISDNDYTLLMYIGRPWHYLGANYLHNDGLFILWTLNFICLYVFVIQSPTNQYRWIEIYAFLNGILPHQQIGKYLFWLFFFVSHEIEI
jgi:hypothetical protein